MDVVAFVDDLMDRSRITAAVSGVRFARAPDAAGAADVAIVDLARHAAVVRALRAGNVELRIVGFGPHVDGDVAQAAHADGADLVLPRSRFFHDVAAALTL